MNLKSWFQTNSIPGYPIIRIILGYVFIVAGTQKFIFTDDMGPGRFMEMGYSYPEFTAYFVGTFELLCGILILIGLASRFAAIPLIITMVVAIVTTKFPELSDGFWDFAHAVRLDFSMLMCAVFVLINGADKRSADHEILKKLNQY